MKASPVDSDSSNLVEAARYALLRRLAPAVKDDEISLAQYLSNCKSNPETYATAAESRTSFQCP